MTAPRCSCASHLGACLVALGEPKNALCRPCAKGNHSGRPCRRHQPERLPHLVRTCADCGFDSAAHPTPPELGGRA